MGPSIEEYLRRIDATLEPFAGRFLIRDGELDGLEGVWPGHLMVIEFPDRAILPLRTDNSEADVALAEGVPEGHRTTVSAAALHGTGSRNLKRVAKEISTRASRTVIHPSALLHQSGGSRIRRPPGYRRTINLPGPACPAPRFDKTSCLRPRRGFYCIKVGR
jgi:uncharacterized protein (DUF1330 family)